MKSERVCLKATERGFTLIELLVVMAIIAVLMSLILTVLSMVQKKAREVEIHTFISDIQAAIKRFELAYQRDPWDEVDENQPWNVDKDDSPWDLTKEISAEQIFRELVPGDQGLKADVYTDILYNRNRTNFMEIPSSRRNLAGEVVDKWHHPFHFAWDDTRRRLIIWSDGADGVNDTVDFANGEIFANFKDSDDISNL